MLFAFFHHNAERGVKTKHLVSNVHSNSKPQLLILLS